MKRNVKILILSIDGKNVGLPLWQWAMLGDLDDVAELLKSDIKSVEDLATATCLTTSQQLTVINERLDAIEAHLQRLPPAILALTEQQLGNSNYNANIPIGAHIAIIPQ